MAKSPQPDHVDHPLERLMFFSDAVFAIAITLLVIEIEVPHLTSTDPSEAWRALRELIPSFLGYALSFAVIGRFWIGHHNSLGIMARHFPGLVWPNLALLATVAFMPFATAYLAKNLGNPGAVQFYNITLLAVALASARVVWMATSPEHRRPDVDAVLAETYRTRSVAVIVAAATTLLASFFIPYGFSELLLALIPLWQRLFMRLGKRSLPA